MKLVEILDNVEFRQIVIFCRTRVRAYSLNQYLLSEVFPSYLIHGEMEQSDRFMVFGHLKTYKARILVTTDLMGRGVDMSDVEYVINYDMAQSSDQYLHRVGRAGRFGTKGVAITFEASEEERRIMQQIQEKFVIKVKPFPKKINEAKTIGTYKKEG